MICQFWVFWVICVGSFVADGLCVCCGFELAGFGVSGRCDCV